MTLYLGLISGTSMDGIDAALLSVEPARMQLRAATEHAWPKALQRRLRTAAEHPEKIDLDELGALDTAVGIEFAHAAQQLLRASDTKPSDVRAIGSHGQTLLHRPRADAPFTLQVGDPNIIAERLGIDVVADFRRRDLAAGGEGAPLVPAFHAAAFAAPGEWCAVVNIGGIANVTLIAPDGTVIGFDTGPGNCLLDSWARQQLGASFDHHGAWAASGQIVPALLARWLADPYFARTGPKSTGRETFSDAWFHAALSGIDAPADVQASLAQLTADSIAQALRRSAPVQGGSLHRVLVCGGGAFNGDLMGRLTRALPAARVESTAAHGIAPEHVEAAAFAWLAHRYLEGLPGNVPAVTGARHGVPLGALFRGATG